MHSSFVVSANVQIQHILFCSTNSRLLWSSASVPEGTPVEMQPKRPPEHDHLPTRSDLHRGNRGKPTVTSLSTGTVCKAARASYMHGK